MSSDENPENALLSRNIGLLPVRHLSHMPAIETRLAPISHRGRTIPARVSVARAGTRPSRAAIVPAGRDAVRDVGRDPTRRGRQDADEDPSDRAAIGPKSRHAGP